MDIHTSFQTPLAVACYMADLIPFTVGTILEPTPGIGNLIAAVENKGSVYAPERFEDIPKGSRFDYAIMNPPFTPMAEGYRILFSVMEMTDNIVALMPWLTIINSQKRMEKIMNFGLISITHLPRNTFLGTRVQSCILHMNLAYNKPTVFKNFTKQP